MNGRLWVRKSKSCFLWLKFHENQTLGSVKSDLHPLTLTSWVKDARPFVTMRHQGGRRFQGSPGRNQYGGQCLDLAGWQYQGVGGHQVVNNFLVMADTSLAHRPNSCVPRRYILESLSSNLFSFFSHSPHFLSAWPTQVQFLSGSRNPPFGIQLPAWLHHCYYTLLVAIYFILLNSKYYLILSLYVLTIFNYPFDNKIDNHRLYHTLNF